MATDRLGIGKLAKREYALVRGLLPVLFGTEVGGQGSRRKADKDWPLGIDKATSGVALAEHFGGLAQPLYAEADFERLGLVTGRHSPLHQQAITCGFGWIDFSLCLKWLARQLPAPARGNHLGGLAGPWRWAVQKAAVVRVAGAAGTGQER